MKDPFWRKSVSVCFAESSPEQKKGRSGCRSSSSIFEPVGVVTCSALISVHDGSCLRLSLKKSRGIKLLSSSVTVSHLELLNSFFYMFVASDVSVHLKRF